MATYIRLTHFKDCDNKEQWFFKGENLYKTNIDISLSRIKSIYS